jgi:hypothetical protein
MQPWEYMQLILKERGWVSDSADLSSRLMRDAQSEPPLNAIGREGWELVSVGFDEDGEPTRYIFKRPAP